MSKLLQRSLEAKLAALDGPEWDSDDDAEEEVVKEQKTKKKSKKKKKDSSPSQSAKSSKKSNDDGELSNVIYIGHIPPAFEEAQILSFFSQFGQITNIKLSRSRRTGNPRGYAFAQFDDEEVASIVANTMGGYLLMGERKLVCHVVPKDKVHPKLFQGSKRNLQLCQGEKSSRDRMEYWQDKERAKVNKERSMEGIKKITKRLLSREKKKREQLKKLGIDYDFPGYAGSVEHMQSTDDDTPAPPANEEEVAEDVTNDSKKKKRKVSVNELENETETITETKKEEDNGEDGKKKKKKKKRRKLSVDASETETADKKDEVVTTTPSKKRMKKSKKKSKKTQGDEGDVSTK
mmetsp:Transcript_8954/g.13361  ORF Transcript_8954/g.13361 Transcript_8954/m.13361 type:complete len:348 (+) Transcript_8954:203-1246(+)